MVAVWPFLAVIGCCVIFLWWLRKKQVQVILGVQVFLGSSTVYMCAQKKRGFSFSFSK
jgi:hypothetical protein